MTRFPSRLLPALVVSALLATVCASLPSARASGEALAQVEAEFRAAIQRLTPATVIVVPRRVSAQSAGFSSGVIVSQDGYVLSDGDAGLVFRTQGGKQVRVRRDDVDIRVPDAETGSFRTYRARVLFRDTTVDTSLVKILEPPARGFAFVPPGRSDQLEVGDFALAVGSQTFEDGGTQPSLTAGIVAAFEYSDAEAGEGRYEHVFISAAVNEGVNGGPLVDLDGRLVGTISTYLKPEPDEPFQFLGKAVPMDRIRAAMADVPAAKRVFAAEVPEGETNTPAHAVETVFHAATKRAHPAVVSLDIARKRPISGSSPLGQKTIDLPRFQGPVSGILLTQDGHVATSLYNVTNVARLVEPFWEAPADADVDAGVADIEGATVHLVGGGSVPATLVGVDTRHGVALFKADPEALEAAGAPSPLPTLSTAPDEAFQRGRFVLALGNPFGAARRPAPLLTMGILSKRHPDTAAAPWRGQWQTDAAGLDSNAGGPVIDIEGRLVGMLTLWLPVKHGRNSGIAFVLPADRLMAAARFLIEGGTRAPGFLGVEFARGIAPVLENVIEGSSADAGGLEPGDRIEAIDGHATATLVDAVTVIRHRTAGETVRVRYTRDGETLETAFTLGARPADD